MQQHVTHLEEIFDILRNAGLKVRAEKWVFGAQELGYLGHINSKEGVRIHPPKGKAIHCFERPKTLTQLTRFLGMAIFHRRFIPH